MNFITNCIIQTYIETLSAIVFEVFERECRNLLN